jgi:hypothetical protein
MRIILWLAAGVAAATLATAAPARPGGNGSGHGGSPAGGWSNGGGHYAGQGRVTRFGIGAIRVDRRRGRHHGRSGRSGRDDSNIYGGGGIAGPVAEVDPYGNGFFTGGGGQIRLRGRQPHFDYDRGYPYQWASPAARPELDQEALATQTPARCTVENRVRVCRGW